MAEVLKVPHRMARDLANSSPKSFVNPYNDAWRAAVATYGIIGIVENRHTGENKRWTSVHELVLKTAEGLLWRAYYEQGLTESQCEEPFEWDGDFVDFKLVERKTVEHYEYRRVE
jgi:hypothetical protein